MATTPTRIKFHRQSQVLEVVFEDGHFELAAEYLRVFSPSAEAKGHGPGQEILQLNKSQVGITSVEPQGNYAIKLVFSDGHDTGIYTWAYLRELGEQHQVNWREYLAKVAEHEATKDVSAVKWINPS